MIKYIINLSLEYELNANKIYDKLSKFSDERNVSKNFILKVLEYMRVFISHYIKDCYKLEPLVSENVNDSISVDESLFSHENNQQIWVVGLINNGTREIRLEIVPDRTSDTMKSIIKFFVPNGNTLITDIAACYNWIADPSRNYVHHMDDHSHSDFGYSFDSTSHIKQLWNHIKHLIKSIYNIIPNTNFALFLKEAEFQRNHKKFSKINIIDYFTEVCQYDYNALLGLICMILKLLLI